MLLRVGPSCTVALFALVAACKPSGSAPPDRPVEPAFAAGQKQLAVHVGAITWRPCPKGLPAACSMAVLEGDPKKAQLFTLRLRSTEPFNLPPHRHPKNERVTVLEGTIHVGFGTRVDRSSGTAFGPGDYYVNAAGMTHYVWTTEPVTLQITGIGPWVVELVAAAD
jgi:hypothetical protein